MNTDRSERYKFIGVKQKHSAMLWPTITFHRATITLALHQASWDISKKNSRHNLVSIVWLVFVVDTHSIGMPSSYSYTGTAGEVTRLRAPSVSCSCHLPRRRKWVSDCRPLVWRRGEGYTFTINHLTTSYGHFHKPYRLTCDADGRIPPTGHEVCTSKLSRKGDALNSRVRRGKVQSLTKKLECRFYKIPLQWREFEIAIISRR